MQSLKEDALRLLTRFYGYTSFRSGQFEIISAVCSGRDALALMPTGGGKSLCYQLPALLLPGCALVVSPLIALMDDQTESLITNGIPAAAIHSNSTETANQAAIEAALDGRIKLLYVSPERLLSDMDLWVKRLDINLIAIDEAHCISQWGHDFRPVYTRLNILKETFPTVPMLALTATADRLTREDISRMLMLDNPLRWIGSFDRPNLSIRVIDESTKKQRIATIVDLIERYPHDSGIVYTLSRKGADEMAEILQRKGYRVAVYHAGMTATEREEAQRAFSNGDVQAVCATIAFGMGIDKGNIRWVVHNNLPGTIESYYQEIGRAGRDGLPSETVLFHSWGDIVMRRKFCMESGQPEVAAQKLSTMREYAESGICRRRILLSYFGEVLEHDCRNCDACLSPRERFDGTVLVQKAGSAIIRLGQKVGVMTLVDVLRGSARAEIIRQGYNKIPTYGVGRDLSAARWNAYIGQMIQLGLFEVAFDEQNHLRVTPYGMKVVRGQARIELNRYEGFKGFRKQAAVRKDVAEEPSEQLLIRLKTVRRSVAKRHNIGIESVFSDVTLIEMARSRPTTLSQLRKITGVSYHKSEIFGPAFIAALKAKR